MFEQSAELDLLEDARQRAGGLQVVCAGFRFIAEQNLMPRPEEAEFARKLARQVEQDVERLCEKAEKLHELERRGKVEVAS